MQSEYMIQSLFSGVSTKEVQAKLDSCLLLKKNSTKNSKEQALDFWIEACQEELRRRKE